MTDTRTSVAVVMPTYNRLPALQANFDSVLDIEGVSEIVVVVDGSNDGSAEWLATRGDARVRVVCNRSQLGSPASRNVGIGYTSADWMLLMDDDCRVPRDFATTLLDVAQERDAAIVSAPWLHVAAEQDTARAVLAGRAAAVPRIGLNTHPSVFPSADIDTPFLCCIALVSREVFAHCSFDAGLSGNAWREETSFFLDATRAGFRCTLTPRTASCQVGEWTGGQRRGRAAYEYWIAKNNLRFLVRHRHTLSALGETRDPLAAQAQFLLDRWMRLIRGAIRARLRRDQCRARS